MRRPQRALLVGLLACAALTAHCTGHASRVAGSRAAGADAGGLPFSSATDSAVAGRVKRLRAEPAGCIDAHDCNFICSGELDIVEHMGLVRVFPRPQSLCQCAGSMGVVTGVGRGMLVVPASPVAVPIRRAGNGTQLWTSLKYRGFVCNFVYEVVGGSVLGLANGTAMSAGGITLGGMAPSACIQPQLEVYRCSEAFSVFTADGPHTGNRTSDGVDVTVYPTGAAQCVVGTGSMPRNATALDLVLQGRNFSVAVQADRGKGSLVASGSALGLQCTATYDVALGVALGVRPPPGGEGAYCDQVYSGLGLECFLFAQTILNQPHMLLNASSATLCGHPCFTNATHALAILGKEGCTIPGWGARSLSNMSTLLTDAICHGGKPGEDCTAAFDAIPDAAVSALEGYQAEKNCASLAGTGCCLGSFLANVGVMEQLSVLRTDVASVLEGDALRAACRTVDDEFVVEAACMRAKGLSSVAVVAIAATLGGLAALALAAVIVVTCARRRRLRPYRSLPDGNARSEAMSEMSGGSSALSNW